MKREQQGTTARPLAALVMAVALVAGCAADHPDPPPASQIRADAANVVDAREIVALAPGRAAADRLDRGARGQGFGFRERVELAGIGLWMLRYEIPAPLDGPGAIAALEAIEPAATAGVNHAYVPAATTPAPPATAADRFDYASALMHWPAGGCPARGPIGMLDTGVDPALAARTGTRIETGDFARGAPGPDSHGTEVAAVLLDPRRLQGMALYAADVIGRSARGREEAGVDSLLRALDWLAAHDVRLVNISLAGPYNKLLDRGVDRAVARGMIIVAAVGNDGAGAAPRYPAALPNVVAVTAVDARGRIYDKAVRGAHVDAAAPGVDIYVDTGGAGHFVSGTSMAVPFVTARIAADPALYGAPAGAIRQRLGASTVDLGQPGRDAIYGAGLVVAGPDC